jgi:hypothetical protein
MTAKPLLERVAKKGSFQKNKEDFMKKTIWFLTITLSFFLICSCTSDSKDVPSMGVDFKWQPIDYGSQENPEIKLTSVPEGTKRFFVSLVDLNISTYDHGGGFVDNDGSGIIARGTIKGNYNGPAPWLPDMVHDYEINVKAYDEDEKVIGMGKKVETFTFGVARQSGTNGGNQ